jgi:hypothetical protein
MEFVRLGAGCLAVIVLVAAWVYSRAEYVSNRHIVENFRHNSEAAKTAPKSSG